MMFKFFVLFVLYAMTSGVKASNESKPNSNYELPCLSFGGICVHTDECPEDKRSEIKGLCPLRQRSGVECCHSLPKSETRCKKRGGECFPKHYRCSAKYIFSRATDCAADENCCILVN